jgi:hypothetical protein
MSLEQDTLGDQGCSNQLVSFANKFCKFQLGHVLGQVGSPNFGECFSYICGIFSTDLGLVWRSLYCRNSQPLAAVCIEISDL